MGSMSIWHWIIVLLIVTVLFGKGKIPGLMDDVAKGIKAFKKGMRENDDDTHSAGGGASGGESGHAAALKNDPAQTVGGETHKDKAVNG